MSSRDHAVLDDYIQAEPDYENLVWNCPLCGKFTSARLGPHPECEQIMWEQEQDQLRRWSYGL